MASYSARTIRGEAGALAVRVQARGPQDFIGVGIADACQKAGAHENALDLAAKRLQARGELFMR
jgi:hypothetical protein